MAHYKGNDYVNKYNKAIAISEEDMKYIENNKGKKSKAGFLDMIINYYKENK